MRAFTRMVCAAVIAVAGWPAGDSLALAASLDTTADTVFGQPGFTTNTTNNGGLGAASLGNTSGAAVDAHGNLFVADTENNRVLEYDAPLSTHAAADRVFGQPSFITNTVNNGGRSATSLNGPTAVALDGAGNLYVADANNDRVLEYDLPLTTDTTADRVFGQPGFLTGASGAGASGLSAPLGLAIDGPGNLYVADTSNNRVLEYLAPLTTNTVADRVIGQPSFAGTSGNNGGLSAASLLAPFGVAVDAYGNLYVADLSNNRVLEYDAPLSTHAAADRVLGQPNFITNTVNNGGLGARSLDHPKGVAVDVVGDVFVLDTDNHRMLEYNTPIGSHGTAAARVFGQPDFTHNASNNGGLSATSLAGPEGLALDGAGNLYVADGNNRVLRYDQPLNTSVTADRVVGQPDFASATANNGGLNAASLNTPISAAFDAAGNLYVADTQNNRVLEYNAPVSTHAAANRVFGQPSFITSTENTGGLSAASLSGPNGVALDTHGNLYVADTGNHRVLEYGVPLQTDTTADRVLGQPSFFSAAPNNGGLSNASLNGPRAVAVDAFDNVFVVDTANHRVLEYNTPLDGDTKADHVFGQPNFITNTINTGGLSANTLFSPEGVAVDGLGNLYVADTGNNRLLEYNTPLTSNVQADRVFGQPSFITNTINTGGLSAASLRLPFNLAVDAAGNLYVADSFNSRVLEYNSPLTSDTTADRVFGQPNFNASAANNGGVSANGLSFPNSVTIDPAGDLYVVDSNSRVLEYDLPVPHGLPALAALSPATVAAGGPAFTLTINGSDYVSSSAVRWDAASRPTTYLSGLRLDAALSAADVAAGGPFSVSVFTPAPGGGASTALSLTLYLRAAQDARADLVFGQPSFAASDGNNAVLPGGANRLLGPQAVAVDPATGRLFVADTDNNRVLSWPNARALANAQAADMVIGQPNFSFINANSGGVSAASLNGPRGLALDAQGNLFVADTDNNRVLEYDAPLSSQASADRVFGQPSFITNTANNGGTSASSLNQPYGVVLDAQGNMFAADANNNRVLVFNLPLASDASADHVLGQPNFISNTANNGGLGASSLFEPSALALDGQGNLFVSDDSNQRVLEYDQPLTSDLSADRVFGQPGFVTSDQNHGGISDHSLKRPGSLAVDTQGNLFVADVFNNRVLEYDDPLAHDTLADRVIGQQSFITNTANIFGLSASNLSGPAGLAVDPAGNLFVADSFNNRVLEYDRPLPLLELFLPLVRR